MARLDKDIDRDIKVATACGPGVGRFLAEALRDALQSDMQLVAVRDSVAAPSEGLCAVDFIFAREGAERAEVIRAGLDSEGRVVSTQLIRRKGRVAQRDHGSASELLTAIRSGESVSALHWIERAAAERVLAITVRSERRFQIPLGH